MLSLLPGASITTKVADTVFTALGWSDKVAFDEQTFKLTANTWFNALCMAFYLTPAMLMGDAIGALTLDDTSANNELRNVRTNYAASRITTFSVACRNSGPSTVHGTWGIGFWPFVTSSDDSSLAFLKQGIHLSDIRQAPVYVTGPSSKPLLLKHRFTLMDWFARTPSTHTKRIGLIAIAYQEDIRGSYGNFTASDFDPMIEVAGSVIMTTRRADQTTAFSNRIDTLNLPSAVVNTDTKKYLVHSKFNVTKDAGKDYCVVSGTARNVAKDMDLDSMSLE